MLLIYGGLVILALSYFLTRLIQIIYDKKINYRIVFLTLFASIYLHELAHKLIALRYSLASIISVDQYYLLFTAFFLIFTNTLVPPPIFTNVFGKYTEYGLMYYLLSPFRDAPIIASIAIAGPLINLILAIVSHLILKYKLYDVEQEKILFKSLRDINAMLFIVNMLPLPGTDGYTFFKAISVMFS